MNTLILPTNEHIYLDTLPQPLDIDLIRVRLDSLYDGPHGAVMIGTRKGKPVTGRIGRIEIESVAGDAIKLGSQAHDLVVESGVIVLPGRRNPDIHQDAFQIQGGYRVTFHNFLIDAPAASDAIFCNSGDVMDIEDVVFEDCVLSCRNVDIDHNYIARFQHSLRSGCRNCLIESRHPADSPKFSDALHFTDMAFDAVNEGNEIVPPLLKT